VLFLFFLNMEKMGLVGLAPDLTETSVAAIVAASSVATAAGAGVGDAGLTRAKFCRGDAAFA
jgi:hypothetical protein